MPGRVVSAGGAGGLGDGVVAPGMWSVCVENGVLSKAALLVVLSNGVFCRECGAGGSGGGCCAERFCAGQDGFGGRVVRWGRNGRGVVMLLAVVARSGGAGAPVRRGARVYVGFRRYERESACLEGSRSGVIVPVCEERGERIMPGRGAAAPGMSAGSLVAGGGVSAGDAGRGAVEWGCFAGNVEWADRRGNAAPNVFVLGGMIWGRAVRRGCVGNGARRIAGRCLEADTGRAVPAIDRPENLCVSTSLSSHGRAKRCQKEAWKNFCVNLKKWVAFLRNICYNSLVLKRPRERCAALPGRCGGRKRG